MGWGQSRGPLSPLPPAPRPTRWAHPEPWSRPERWRCSCCCSPRPTLFRQACLTCVLWSSSTQAWPAEHPSPTLGAAQQPSAVSTAPRAFVPPGPAAVRPPRPPSSVARVPRCCGFLTLRAPGCSCSFCVIGRLETVMCVPGEDQGSLSFQSVGPAGAEVGRSSLGWGPGEGRALLLSPPAVSL